MDFLGEALPNWIAAGAAALALVFAGIAGKWARKAALSAAEQAAETRKEVQIAERQLEIARADANQAKDSAEKERRITLESRFDLLAPTIYGVGTLRDPAMLEMADGRFHGPLEFRADPQQNWMPLTIREREFDADDRRLLQFRVIAVFVLRNVSDTVAVVGMERNSSRGEFDWPGGSTRAIEPRGEISLTWSRIWTTDQLASVESINEPENRIFDYSITVWDIGYRVEDRYRFFAGLLFFSRDGSRLVATREPQGSPEWQEGGVTAAFVERKYVALDGTDDPE